MEENILKENKKVVVWLSVMGVVAVVFAVGWLSSGSVQAGMMMDVPRQDVNTVEVEPFSEEKWNELRPRAARSTRGGAEAQSADYTDANLTTRDAGGKVIWQMGGIPGDAYDVYRRVIEPDETLQGWQLMEEAHRHNWYEETEGAFGFKYQYKIIRKRTLSEDKEYITVGLDMPPRDKVFGFGVIAEEGDMGVDLFIRNVDVPSGEALRVQRFDSGHAVGQPVGSETGLTSYLDHNDVGLVAGKVYRYLVEVVRAVEGDPPGTVEPTGVSFETFVKAGKPTFPVPGVVSTVDPRLGIVDANGDIVDPGYFQVDWEAPSGIHRSQFAMYEILRKDAKDLRSKYSIVAVSVDRTVKDYSVVGGPYYRYAVRLVGWGHVHGDEMSGPAVPVIPQPQCRNQDGVTAEVISAHLMPVTSVPWNRWFAVRAKLQNAGTTQDPWCEYFDGSDWYVERQAREFYTVSFPTCDVLTTCNGLWVENALKDEGFKYHGGEFRLEAPVSMQGADGLTVWYDDSFTVDPGLYRHEYRMCSYAEGPQICSQVQTGDWRFEGGDEMRVVPYIP